LVDRFEKVAASQAAEELIIAPSYICFVTGHDFQSCRKRCKINAGLLAPATLFNGLKVISRIFPQPLPPCRKLHIISGAFEATEKGVIPGTNVLRASRRG
jgi:hypothetical protein